MWKCLPIFKLFSLFKVSGCIAVQIPLAWVPHIITCVKYHKIDVSIIFRDVISLLAKVWASFVILFVHRLAISVSVEKLNEFCYNKLS